MRERERERERDRKRQTEVDVTIIALKLAISLNTFSCQNFAPLAMSFNTFPCQKIALFVSPFTLPVSPFLNGHHCGAEIRNEFTLSVAKKIRPLCSESLKWHKPRDE